MKKLLSLLLALVMLLSFAACAGPAEAPPSDLPAESASPEPPAQASPPPQASIPPQAVNGGAEQGDANGNEETAE